MTATLTSDDLDNDRCPKCGLRINDTTLVAIPRAQHEALMVAVKGHEVIAGLEPGSRGAFMKFFQAQRRSKEALAALRAAGIQMEEKDHPND